MSTVTDDHLLGFGAIISRYAYAEAFIKNILSRILDIEVHVLATLVEPCSSSELRNVAKSIAKLKMDPGPDRDRFCWLVGELGSFGPLRNTIAHRRWTEGKRDGAIKPVAIDIRSGSTKLIGAEDDEKDWTAQELVDEANRLIVIGNELTDYFEMVFPDIAENTDETNSSIDPPEGSSTKDS